MIRGGDIYQVSWSVFIDTKFHSKREKWFYRVTEKVLRNIENKFVQITVKQTCAWTSYDDSFEMIKNIYWINQKIFLERKIHNSSSWAPLKFCLSARIFKILFSHAGGISWGMVK